MASISMEKALVAVDLGAQSCRVSVLRRNGNEADIRVIHRFTNGPVSRRGGLRWDIQGILEGIKSGLRRCAQHAPEGIASIAVDGWAVDYVRLQEDGTPAEVPFCYRDARTEDAARQLHAIISPERLYALTGIQILSLNTLYQLYADKLARSDPSMPWINLPEFISYSLGGTRASEFTNATHTAMVALGQQRWCEHIFQEAGLDMDAAPEIVPSGTSIGTIGGDLGRMPQFRGTQIIVPACHDTASAIAAIPALGDDWAFISSGTWSLVGTVIDSPKVTEGARTLNFTNLGGIGGTTYFLKNVNGMWLLQQCMEAWEKDGNRCSLQDLISECERLPAPLRCVDVDDSELMLPGDMPSKLSAQLQRAGQPPFKRDSSAIPLVANLLFHSLASRYSEVLSAVQRITGKKLKRLFVVGGGNQNTFLNRLTAERTGLSVTLGHCESSTIGNFAVQLAALEGAWNRAEGVSAGAVMKWAKWMSSGSLAAVGDQSG